jgi:uncharacterized membrane protein
MPLLITWWLSAMLILNGMGPPPQLPAPGSLSEQPEMRAAGYTQPGPEPKPVVRLVMFWSETCGHCHYILAEVLPPLQSRYGEQLEVYLISLESAADVDRLYQTAAAYGIPKEQVGVPLLLIGEYALAGSVQIPEQLPGLIERYLEQGGVDYPALDALVGVLPSSDPSGEGAASEICNSSTPCPDPLPATATAAAVAPVQQPGSPPPGASGQETFSDGFAIAVLTLAGLAASLLAASVALVRRAAVFPTLLARPGTGGLFVILCLVGLGVAGYLAYVETQMATAVCGPIGDCNTVQSSPYARLFGILPVGVLGVMGYLGLLAAWAGSRLGRGRRARMASLAVFGMAFLGALFSLYLTYLEPFVIQAVCMWCITSAVIMAALLLLSVNPAVASLSEDA